MVIAQFVPQEFCFKCQGCCRFREKESIWQPVTIDKLIPYQDYYICPELDIKTNRCKNYDKRPLDCQLYPFLLHRKNGDVFLALDRKCALCAHLPAGSPNGEAVGKAGISTDEIRRLAQKDLLDFLGQPEIKNTIRETPKLINDYGEDALIISPLKELSLELKLNRLTLKDKPLVDKYIALKKHNLAVYSFANIFIWSRLFDIFYKVIDGALCVFFKDKIGIFMYTAPLAKKITPAIINEAFNIMDSFNENKEISRIENIEETEVSFYKQLGLNCSKKFADYIYRTRDIAMFCGNKFKSQRSSLNFFIKNHSASITYKPYAKKLSRGCLELLNEWVKLRKPTSDDKVFNGCLDDTLLCQKIALENFAKLDLIGRVVKIKQKICAFSFLYKLNKNTICVFFETTDLNIKGSSQFIFSKIAQEFSEFKFINCLDDSGFENIKRHKLSYRPYKLEQSFIAKR